MGNDSTGNSPGEADIKPAGYLGVAFGLALSALLMVFAFLPALGGISVWVALVPGMLVARKAGLKPLFWLSWLFGYLACLALFYWVLIVTVVGGLLLPVYLGLYWAAFFVGVELLRRRVRVPGVLAAICLWPLLECARGWALTGLPWFFLGHSQYLWPRLMQSADLGGVIFLSTIIVAVNATVAAAIYSRQRRGRVSAAAIAALVFAANLGYGSWRLGTVEMKAGPTVALVQPNVAQDLKITQDEFDSARIFRSLRKFTLSEEAAAADVVIWPETIMPGLVDLPDYSVANGMTPGDIVGELLMRGFLTAGNEAEVWKLASAGMDVVAAAGRVAGRDASGLLTSESLLKATASIAGKPMIAGSIAAETGTDGRITKVFNRASLFDREGFESARFDKVHLVPFGEFIPFREAWPALSRVIGSMMPVNPRTYAGPDFSIFEVGGVRYGPAICFEDTFAYIARRYRCEGADVLLNLTNDGWFADSFELEAHLANAAFRAVETRMAVVRCANTGISAVVSPAGEVTARLRNAAGRDRAVEGLLIAQVPVSSSQTFYTRGGDNWLFALAGVLISCAVVRVVRSG